MNKNKKTLATGVPVFNPEPVVKNRPDTHDAEENNEPQEQPFEEDILPTSKTKKEHIEKVILIRSFSKTKKCVYIDEGLHQKLAALKNACPEPVSITDIVNNILSQHLIEYKDEYNRLLKKSLKLL